jgi:hypothetical protein
MTNSASSLPFEPSRGFPEALTHIRSANVVSSPNHPSSHKVCTGEGLVLTLEGTNRVIRGR